MQASQHFQLARYGVRRLHQLAEDDFLLSPNYQASDIVMLATRFDDAGKDSEVLEDTILRLRNDGKTVVVVKNIFEFPAFREGSMTLADKVFLEMREQGILIPHISPHLMPGRRAPMLMKSIDRLTGWQRHRMHLSR